MKRRIWIKCLVYYLNKRGEKMKIIDVMKNPKKIVFSLGMKGMLKFIPDVPYLKLMYWANIGKRLNLDNPKTFNEKIQWMKLHNTNPLYSILVDKYEVKKFVANKIGEEYIIPTLGIWDKFDDINFDELPNQFVLKCTHDSGGLVICKDKNQLDIKKAKHKINKCLKRNYYYVGREYPYKNVKPRIIAEKYMENSIDGELKDYKFFTFDGVAEVMFIASDRENSSIETKFDFYDMEFAHLDFTNGHPNAISMPHKPEKFDEMRKIAEILSEGIPHVRVDFYEVNGKVYFGEMTFSHWSGFQPFDPDIWDEKFGYLIKLPRNAEVVIQ